MEPLSAAEIFDFTIRGNCSNRRRVAVRQLLPTVEGRDAAVEFPGYSPPTVDVQFKNGRTSSVAVSSADLPTLCGDDFDEAKRYLSLILNARDGGAQAAAELPFGEQRHRQEPEQEQALESDFVVPSTTCEPHSEHDISQKGYILLKLSQRGYPVPDFTVITSRAYEDRAQHMEAHVADATRQLEILTGQKLGDTGCPMVFALRCATASYIPGLMDTYLNVGVTENTLPSLERMYGVTAGRKMFLNNLKNLCQCLPREEHAAIVNMVNSALPEQEVDRLIECLGDRIRRINSTLLQDPFAQAVFFAQRAYKHFEEDQELVLTLCRGTEHYPSLILQKMICTVRHENAYAGVISSRHTQTGLGMELQSAHNIFGEEMMTGTAQIESTDFADREVIKERFPAVYHFVPHIPELEREFEAPVLIEFAVEATRRYQSFALLQLNQTGMAGRAAITSAVDLHKAGVISRQRVTELVRPYHIKQLTSDSIDQEDFGLLNYFCSGISVLPRSAVSVRVYFSGNAALRAKSDGDQVCLCQKTFLPTDSVVMREMDAILSLTSAAVHVVTICHSLGVPALLSLEKNGVTLEDGKLINAGGMEIKEGDWITISSRRRAVYEGKAKYQPARLLRYMRGEPIEMDEGERETFRSIAYVYRYYQQLTRDLEVDQISTLSEVTRLVNFELRGQSEEAGKLVNAWFDDREALYTDEVLKSDLGDHLGQSNVFEMLTPERKIRFFKRALAKCSQQKISGYEAGAFMLGRFLCMRYPVSFWKCFTPAEAGLLVNEWVLFEKYMQVLRNVGERKIVMARKQMLKYGLDQLSLHPGYLQPLITLKLSGARLEEAKASLPEWSDPQTARVLELLQQPYAVFYDFEVRWSRRQLETVCEENGMPVPQPLDC